MAKGKMWFGTFHHAEFIDCPVVGSDFSPESWGTGGTFLSGGGFEVGAPDAHKVSNLSWSAASTIPAAARIQAYRDGAYSQTPGDLFYFHDPLSYAVNILPKRWAQPSLMVRTKRPWATAEVPGPGTRGLPLTGAHIAAGTTDPTGPGAGVLFIPIPHGMTLFIGAQNTVTVTGGGVFTRTVLADGTAETPSRIIGGNRYQTNNPSGALRGVLLYFKGEVNVMGMRACLVPHGAAAPVDFPITAWDWHSGMGHSGSRFTAPPTYVPSNGVAGGMASFSATFREVGDWLQ